MDLPAAITKGRTGGSRCSKGRSFKTAAYLQSKVLTGFTQVEASVAGATEAAPGGFSTKAAWPLSVVYTTGGLGISGGGLGIDEDRALGIDGGGALSVDGGAPLDEAVARDIAMDAPAEAGAAGDGPAVAGRQKSP